VAAILVRIFSLERLMIVCSCNVLSDVQVKSAIASGTTRPGISHVYDWLGCAARCGRCARTIKAMLAEISRLATPESRSLKSANLVEQPRHG